LVTILSLWLLVTQVVELMTSRSGEAASSTVTELEHALEQLMSSSVCYVTLVSLCAAAHQSGVNTKFWTSLEQRALDVLEKVFSFETVTAFLCISLFSMQQHICYSTLYAIARPSVCLSVCQSHGWISQRWLKLGSCNLHHRVVP